MRRLLTLLFSVGMSIQITTSYSKITHGAQGEKDTVFTSGFTSVYKYRVLSSSFPMFVVSSLAQNAACTDSII
jgi:hypothetical protein